MASIKRGGYIHRLFLFGSEHRWKKEDLTVLNLCTVFWTCLAKGLSIVAGIGAASWLLAIIVVSAIASPADLRFAILFIFLVICAAGLLSLALGGGAFLVEVITSSETWHFIKGEYCPRLKVED